MRFFIFLLFSLSLSAEETFLTPISSPPSPLLVRKEDDASALHPTTTKSSPDLLANGPWLTGPLLTPSAVTVPPGHFNIEPYLFYNNNLGFYNTEWENQSISPTNGNLNFIAFIQTGILSFMDITIYPQFSYNFSNGADCWRFGDLNVFLSFQLLNDIPGTWVPAIRFGIGEIFPTGQYQDLNPANYGTDVGGQGSYQTFFSLIFSNLWHFKGEHYLANRLAVQMGFSSPVDVSGFNTYGGNAATEGTVYPGISQSTFLGLEYTFTKHWALALDVASLFSAASPFEGNTGGAVVGSNSYSYTLSLSPAIEYNVSPYIGFIGGVWFSVLGHNAFSFVNGVIAVNFFFP